MPAHAGATSRPATARNREPILAALARILRGAGLVLGLDLVETVAMPANNLSVVLARAGDRR